MEKHQAHQHHMSEQPFFEFLQYCIGARPDQPASLQHANWQQMYHEAQKQALLGVLFHGIRQLPKELAPPTPLLMQWMAVAQQLRQQNELLFKESAGCATYFQKHGFATCVLKGQGHALMYPNPYMRTPGDIDIYLTGGRRRVGAFIESVTPGQVMRYHHIDFPKGRVPVEVHFTPSYMYNPWHNRRMQQWFKAVMAEQCAHKAPLPNGDVLAVPTVKFNAVYVLSHLYRHVFTEGFGLRQLLDYYYIVRQCANLSQHDIATICNTIEHLGMRRFAGGVMYLLHVCFALSEQHMLFSMNHKEGTFLLHEVMTGGNFGQHDHRLLGSKAGEGKWQRYVRMTLRNARFIAHYPTEALSEPLFRTSFAVWKKVVYREK